jgi:uncharacterized integral membrane protein (TIGR00698 family)
MSADHPEGMAADGTDRDMLPARQLRLLSPGLAITVIGLTLTYLVANRSGAVSSIAVAVGLGILSRNLRLVPSIADPGLAFAAKRVLRLGVVLLGFRLALSDVWAVGGTTLAVVVVTVLSTLSFTYWLGRRLSLSPTLALLTGTGYAVCGATAIAAMREVVGADDDSPAFAIALVTLFGTISIVVLPLLASLMGLSTAAFGQWAGTAVHDVGQVVATAASGGDEALEIAVVVKLVRVLMLGPLLLAIGVVWRRQTNGGVLTRTRHALVPPFIVAFLGAVAIRTSGILSEETVQLLRTVEGICLTAALFSLGTGVRLERLRMLGRRAVFLGVIAFVFVLALTLLGVVFVH